MMKQSSPKVAVIGGGIFGVTAALELSVHCEVDLYERGPALLTGATFANHNRHHLGFHYPRSPETARQCIESSADFDERYGSALRWDFPNHYCIGKTGSKVSPDEYLHFCRSVGLEFEEVAPSPEYFDVSRIALCLRVKEAICDFRELQRLALEQIAQSSVRVHLNSEITQAEFQGSGDRKTLTVKNAGESAHQISVDAVVSAIYANHNRFCEWLGFTKRAFQFNLQELDLVQLPEGMRVGLTVMDGSYPSILPFGSTPYHIMAHVDSSQLIRESSFETSPLMNRLPNIESGWESVLKSCREYYPFLNESVYRRSLFVDRVVDSTQSHNDARVTELTDHGRGCYSIFAAKIITSVSTAKKLHTLLLREFA